MMVSSRHHLEVVEEGFRGESSRFLTLVVVADFRLSISLVIFAEMISPRRMKNDQLFNIATS
jgi:hypothetical protein